MVDWEVAVALGVSGLTFVLWGITTYLTFFRSRPKLAVRVPRHIRKDNEWHIYVYNEGNRATRMLEQSSFLIIGRGRSSILLHGKFRPADRVDYFTANHGEYHHFYIQYWGTSLSMLQHEMKAKILLIMKYDNGRRTKLYKKKLKLDQEDVNLFIQKKFTEKYNYIQKSLEEKQEKIS